MKIEIHKAALKAIALLAATNDMRYYLNGVFIEADHKETRAVATDGSRLGIYRWVCSNDAEEPISFIVPRDIIKQLQVKKGEVLLVHFTHIEGLTWELSDTSGLVIRFKAVEGNYPDYRRVIPGHKATGEIAQFNPKLLQSFCDAAAMLGKRKATVSIAHSGDAAASVNVGLDEFFGVLMPVKTSSIPAPYTSSPDWAIARLEAAPAKEPNMAPEEFADLV